MAWANPTKTSASSHVVCQTKVYWRRLNATNKAAKTPTNNAAQMPWVTTANHHRCAPRCWATVIQARQAKAILPDLLWLSQRFATHSHAWPKRPPPPCGKNNVNSQNKKDTVGTNSNANSAQITFTASCAGPKAAKPALMPTTNATSDSRRALNFRLDRTLETADSSANVGAKALARCHNRFKSALASVEWVASVALPAASTCSLAAQSSTQPDCCSLNRTASYNHRSVKYFMHGLSTKSVQFVCRQGGFLV